MHINNDIFNRVDLTAVGLLTTALSEIGTMFTKNRLLEIIQKNELDEEEVVLESLKQLEDEGVLFKSDEFYRINEDYLVN